MENTAQYQEPEQASQARIIPYLLLLFTLLKCLWFHDRVFIDYLIKVFILTPSSQSQVPLLIQCCTM